MYGCVCLYPPSLLSTTKMIIRAGCLLRCMGLYLFIYFLYFSLLGNSCSQYGLNSWVDKLVQTRRCLSMMGGERRGWEEIDNREQDFFHPFLFVFSGMLGAVIFYWTDSQLVFKKNKNKINICYLLPITKKCKRKRFLRQSTYEMRHT